MTPVSHRKRKAGRLDFGVAGDSGLRTRTDLVTGDSGRDLTDWNAGS